MSKRIRTGWFRRAALVCLCLAALAHGDARGREANPVQLPENRGIVAEVSSWFTRFIQAVLREIDYVTPSIPLQEYVVKHGDSLWSIAKALYAKGENWKLLEKVNPKLANKPLRAGQKIKFPKLSDLLAESYVLRGHKRAPKGIARAWKQDEKRLAAAAPSIARPAVQEPVEAFGDEPYLKKVLEAHEAIETSKVPDRQVALLRQAIEREKREPKPVSTEHHRAPTALNEYYAQALAQSGAHEDAKRELSQLVSANASDPRVRSDAARFAISRPGGENCDEALTHIRVARERDASNLGYAVEELSLLVKCDKQTEAKQAATLLVQSVPPLKLHPVVKRLLAHEDKK